MDIDSANKVRLDEQSMAAVHTLAETTFAPADGWAPEHGPRFITEKSYKPMVVRRPFVIMGHHRILQDLRADGYETFPELWDESYDTIENAEETLSESIFESIGIFNISLESDNTLLDMPFSSDPIIIALVSLKL